MKLTILLLTLAQAGGDKPSRAVEIFTGTTLPVIGLVSGVILAVIYFTGRRGGNE